jgi:hypothetical protein
MKLKIIRWIGLIAGSVISVFIAGAILFAGAYFIGGISDGIQGPIIETVVEFLGLLSAILIIVGVVIAWFNTRLGGLLITAMAMIQIIASREPEVIWMQISMLFVGLILLYYVYYNRWLLKKGKA